LRVGREYLAFALFEFLADYRHFSSSANPGRKCRGARRGGGLCPR
jgi:hypothetical protein